MVGLMCNYKVSSGFIIYFFISSVNFKTKICTLRNPDELALVLIDIGLENEVCEDNVYFNVDDTNVSDDEHVFN
jgi:hypothetical protein